MSTEKVEIGVIGGTGLYDMPEITDITTVDIDTPFGKPSSSIRIGTLRGKRVAFLARHGVGHVYSPSTVPYRANIYALKQLGVRFIISVNAAGSLREDYAPGHIVVPDQLLDYTTHRARSFFETGLVAHLSVAEPFSPEMRQLLIEAVKEAGGTVHEKGTFLVEEGPRFATKAESRLFRSWGCDLIGMTSCPETFLALEAEIAYATMAHITDYDVWHETEEPVTVEMVIKTMKRNLDVAQKAIALAVEKLDTQATYPCHTILDQAIQTSRDKISPEMTEKLRAIVGRALGLD
ncbi:MAG: S-methyl-5'-thioadenosine phosphorylase [Chloroflexi bacterium]|nr:MAG: S-methyl-5'-thioadenosine phosphorylase [Chloroflexota bacterium]